MEYKLSYYTIFSEPLNSRHDSVLFCTRTAQSLLISERIRLMLESGNLHDLASEIIEKLVSYRGIVPISENELSSVVEENNSSIEAKTELYEVIQPSAMCQLGCDYCGQDHQKVNISSELSNKIFDRIDRKLTDKKYESLHIGWFGGEPLLGLSQIRHLSRRLQKLCHERGIYYHAKIVTNGMSLKEPVFKELAMQLGVKKIEITLDGTAGYHDSRRHTKDQQKTFDIIFRNILQIVNLPYFEQSGARIIIRCNVDNRNFQGVTPLIDLLASHNLQTKIAHFYPIGVYSWAGNDAHEQSLSKEQFAQMEIDWLIQMYRLGFTPAILPGRQKQICMAVSPVSEMYDAYGNVFNCTEVSYTDYYKDTPYILDNLNSTNNESKQRVFSDWYDSLLTDRFPCHSCKMLPVCGGGCPKSWHEDMRACPTPKFNIKDRLALAYLLSQADSPEFLEA